MVLTPYRNVSKEYLSSCLPWIHCPSLPAFSPPPSLTECWHLLAHITCCLFLPLVASFLVTGVRSQFLLMSKGENKRILPGLLRKNKTCLCAWKKVKSTLKIIQSFKDVNFMCGRYLNDCHMQGSAWRQLSNQRVPIPSVCGPRLQLRHTQQMFAYTQAFVPPWGLQAETWILPFCIQKEKAWFLVPLYCTRAISKPRSCFNQAFSLHP